MAEHNKNGKAAPAPRLRGILAEYTSPHDLIQAATKVRDAGYQRWDSYSPFPVHGLDPAMGIRPTHLPWVVLAAGLTGATVALTFQWWTSTRDYPWIVSGKPLFSWPANIPITFELMVLSAALTAFFSMLIFNRLPHPSHALDNVRRFARATDDRFFVFIDAADARFDREGTLALLKGTASAASVEVVMDEDPDEDARLPLGVPLLLMILGSASIVPFALAALARNSTTTTPRLDIVPDMDFQMKFKAQADNHFFADKRSMRLPVEGTVAVGELREDTHFYQGKQGDAWATTFPPNLELTEDLMNRGQARFGIYCTPCHGEDGAGQGMVHTRAASLLEGTWVQPTDLRQDVLRYKPVGELFSEISNGVRNMPGYARQISVEDRWAILLYVRALQRSQGTPVETVPAAMRTQLK
jgi:mono/diheme cytochrome c family protein